MGRSGGAVRVPRGTSPARSCVARWAQGRTVPAPSPSTTRYFTLPAVIPSTIWRLNATYTAIIGTVTVDNAANSSE